jgi:hypothetical protein
MTDILDKENTIKDEEMRKTWTEFYTKKWQLKNLYNGVDEMVLKEITSRCNGNPLLCFTLFVNLLQNGFLKLDGVNIFVPTTDYLSCVRLVDYTAIPLPRICVKLNCTKIDKSISRITFKAPKE